MPAPSRLALRLAVPAAFAGLLAAGPACAPRHTAIPVPPDSNGASGPDATRAGAQPIPINTPVTDSVDYNHGDETDWKAIELRGKPGLLDVELRWDNSASDLNVDVFDSFGTRVGSSPDALTPQVKKILVPVDEPGHYFVRVMAPGPKMSSTYTVLAGWQGEVAPPPVVVAPPPPPPPPVERRPRHAHHVEHSHHHASESGSTVQGRILSSYRQGGSLVLYLDKGSDAGVAEGQEGKVLEGSSGSSALEGGAFSITKVVGANKSIAKASLRSVGKNTRVVIHTK